LLYLGYVGTTISFAFAMAALCARRLDAEWLAVVRRWSLVSWFFLTAGIIVGMRWSYVELGWGGYWGWDPVENASLLPWLTNTALLHSIVVQEKRGMLRKWNVVLVVVSFLFAMLGALIARGGVVESIHSFARSPDEPWFATFFLLAVGVSIYLVGSRLQDLGTDRWPESVVSRETALLSNNFVLCGIALVVLSGTLFPLLSEWVGKPKSTVSPGFFAETNIPLGMLVLALTGIGPLIAWRTASVSNLKRQLIAPAAFGIAVAVGLALIGMRQPYAVVTYALCAFVAGTIVQEFYEGARARQSIYNERFAMAFVHLVGRNRRRYGGYVVHAGIVMLFAAFAGMAFRSEHDVSLKTGEALDVMDPFGQHWRFVSQGASTASRADRDVMAVGLETFVNGKPLGILSSEKRQYLDAQKNALSEPITEVGIRSTAKLDVYVALMNVTGNDTAQLRVALNPLVAWVWTGGCVMLLGGVIVMWPRAERRRKTLAATPP
jgi:cytochrome c-type biogenesis protein CcmF